MSNFADLGLAEFLLRAVDAEGYTTPTPIQAKVIPALLAGSDVVGIAQTGTGKTASFVLPMLDAIERSGTRAERKHCTGLILAPTRELAGQIAANIRAYARFKRVSQAIVVGGVKHGPQIRSLAAGADIVVATPGRLLDHMNTGAVSLESTSFVVLDEADQMLDLGFMPAIRKIMASLPESRQTVLMSATMPKPIRALAREFQTDPVEISVAPAARPIEQIAQSVRLTPAAEKRQVLAEILAGEGVSRAIVFTRTKRGADRVARHLDDAGLRSAVIHGNKSQSQRTRALAGFRAGKTNILVATDIAARGIDIDDVSHVVNFELPNVAEAYVHRIGRTARAGRDGTAISLCDPTELGLLRDIERLIGSRIDGSQTALAAAPDAGADRDPAPRRGDRPAKHRRFKSGKPKSGQSKFGQGKSRDANSGEANSGEANSGEAKRARSKSGYPKSGQPKSRRGKAGPPRRRPGAAQPQARAA